MSTQVKFFLPINPEPWTSPDAAVIRAKNGKAVPKLHKSAALRTYQQAVHDSVKRELPEPAFGPDAEIELEFYFWRQLPQYEGKGRRVHKHQADATNMQKALEDALQEALFPNDRQVVHVSSWIIEQSETTEPLILVAARQAPDRPDVDMSKAPQRAEPASNEHAGGEGLF